MIVKYKVHEKCGLDEWYLSKTGRKICVLCSKKATTERSKRLGWRLNRRHEEAVCEYCKKVFTRTLCPVKAKRSRTCSHSCRGRLLFSKITKCKFGHQFTPENTGLVKGTQKRCKQCKRVKNRKYRKLNPFKTRISNCLYLALRSSGSIKAGRSVFQILGYTSNELNKHLGKYLGRPCEEKRKCNGLVIEYSNASIDHIIPQSRGRGEMDAVRLNQLSNLRLICLPCNLSKNDK